MRAGRNAAFRDDDAVARCGGDQLEGSAAINPEGVQVAGVDADHFGAEPDRARQLVHVVCLDERIQAELVRTREHRRRAPLVQIAQEQKHGIGSRLLQLVQLSFLLEEALRQERRGARRAGRAQIADGTAEALVDEDRHSCGAGLCESGRELRGIGVRAEISRRR